VTINLPPDLDEFELSLFGPGTGECVVMHVGGGQWVIVDSFIDSRTKQPVALSYLSHLGVDVATAVRLLVVTHWHDDHMRGAAATLEAAVNATFCCSVALRKDEFSKVAAQANDLMAASSDVDEIYRIFGILKDRKAPHSTTAFGRLKYAEEDKRLIQCSPGSAPVELWSLSPSSASITRSLHEFSEMVPELRSGKNHLPRQKANDVSVVLFLQAGDIRVLLGADLQSNTASDRGWRAVLASRARPQERAHVIKVPHHGSQNAHHPDVWRLMLEASPIALVTPYASGVDPLPTERDRARLATLANRAYCTAPSNGWTPPKKGQPVDRVIAEASRQIRAIDAKIPGHLRVRRRFQGKSEFRIEMFNGAYQLS
jgi:hypothetical protein